MIPAANGIRLVDLAIKIALKEKLNKNDFNERNFNFVSQRYIFREKNKKVRNIIIPNWIKNQKMLFFLI